MIRRGLTGMVVLGGLGCCAAIAAASGPVGALPKSNFAPHPPAHCYVKPQSVSCINSAVSYLDKARAHGVRADADPTPSNGKFGYFTSNWAVGLPNLPYSYGAWMYADGLNSGNLDCRLGNRSGCWVHRKNVLFRFAKTGRAAMGAAAGKDRGGRPSYAMLLGRGNRSYRPTYVYTWKQAVADGAGR